MAAGAFGCTRNYGWDSPFNLNSEAHTEKWQDLGNESIWYISSSFPSSSLCSSSFNRFVTYATGRLAFVDYSSCPSNGVVNSQWYGNPKSIDQSSHSEWYDQSPWQWIQSWCLSTFQQELQIWTTHSKLGLSCVFLWSSSSCRFSCHSAWRRLWHKDLIWTKAKLMSSLTQFFIEDTCRLQNGPFLCTG